MKVEAGKLYSRCQPLTSQPTPLPGIPSNDDGDGDDDDNEYVDINDYVNDMHHSDPKFSTVIAMCMTQHSAEECV